MKLGHLLPLLCIAAAPARGNHAAVENTFRDIQRAVEQRDVTTLEKLVHAKFEMLHALGQAERRETWLKLVAGGRLPRQSAEITEYGAEVQVVGTTAFRAAVVRFRDRRAGWDMWMRGTATFVHDRGEWRQLRQQSTFLGEWPVADLKGAADYLGSYAIPGRDGFQIVEENGLLFLRWSSGAKLPLLPQRRDRFGSGPTSHLTFTRDSVGSVTGASRFGSEGVWWTAVRQR